MKRLLYRVIGEILVYLDAKAVVFENEQKQQNIEKSKLKKVEIKH